MIRNTIPMMRETAEGVEVSGYLNGEFHIQLFADDDYIQTVEALPADNYSSPRDLAVEAAQQAAFILASANDHKFITHYNGTQLLCNRPVPGTSMEKETTHTECTYCDQWMLCVLVKESDGFKFWRCLDLEACKRRAELRALKGVAYHRAAILKGGVR